MILSHPTLNKMICMTEDKIEVLVVENKSLFSKYITEINSQINGDIGNFSLYDDNKDEVTMSSIDLIVDPFNIDINNKAVLSAINSKLKLLLIDENHYQKTMGLLQLIEQYMVECAYDLDSYLFVENNEDCANLIKITDSRFLINRESVLEYICDYLRIMHKYTQKELFIFVNLKTFLDQTDIEELYKFAMLSKIPLLLFENHNDINSSCENMHIIDQDLCEIDDFYNCESI